ncbi:hypothetical protein A3A09_01590 [Candidatus Nomurabacteria bacterium RIFCSPLOWO2_01_FULL_42_20]|uniref:Transposase IS200-like domain-containing protein n=1 Tax=Candidatus Nomurabacteria bacterium RIFCSPHIGHO2_01_FULL_42_16 TaxID=1801743 RepID=A0A1F6VJA4_9BACT|nr:MAG: hypothetical protein A2824_03005 [Candidatus Nomurabacteria bacterium RIFCSPHIGHO2_01_FULL_42_16]OGI91804.1 MAG: hypothetical protein A3A09_01590 [Candidatus Nomurabacteria bacterium RIFCSPLOWO2_01_FULL_42_20]
MQRYIAFIENEYYHIYSRGTEKRKTFMNSNDYFRFSLLLYLCNSTENIHLSKLFRSLELKARMAGKTSRQGGSLTGKISKKDLYKLFEIPTKNKLVSIISYCLMPNHFHLILKEIRPGGISIFMKKLLTAYSMHFNKKYERSGALFTRPFKSEHINDDNYFRYLFAYIHLNPVKLIDSKWKENGIKDLKKTKEFLSSYEYSSFLDFLRKNRPERKILAFDDIPDYFSEVSDFKDFIEYFLENTPVKEAP